MYSSPINNMANMEFMLYGGTPFAGTSNAPSFLNGYKGGLNDNLNSIYSSTNSYGMQNYGVGTNYNQYSVQNPYMNNSVFQTPTNTQTTQITNQNNATSFQANGNNFTGGAQDSFQRTASGIAKHDIDILADYYKKSTKEEEANGESVAGAATTGVIPLLFMEQAQNVKHWWNAGNAVKKADGMLKNINGFNTLRESNPQLAQEAYSQLHASIRNGEKKWFWHGWFQKTLSNDVKNGEVLKTLQTGLSPKQQIEFLQNELKSAIESGELNKIAEATTKLKKARGMDGCLTGGKWLAKTPFERLESAMEAGKNGADSVLQRETKELLKKNKVTNDVLTNLGTKAGLNAAAKSIWSAIKKDAPMWIAMDFAMDLFLTKNIQTAFEKDKISGIKQVGQTTVKAAGSAVGWGVGRAVGAWAGAKLGAMIGTTCLGPGIGTAVGGLLGLVGGSVGMCLANKLTKAIVGQDVGEKIKQEKMAETQEGQIELVQYAAQQAQAGKPMDAQTMQALNNVATQFSAVA